MPIQVKFAIGIDDAGRGSWAGPLVLAGIYHPDPIWLQWLGATDSKNTDRKQRARFVSVLGNKPDAWIATSTVDAARINAVGLDEAEAWAVRSVVDDLVARLGAGYEDVVLFVDGHKNFVNLPRELEVRYIARGERYIPQIAAASMVAGHVYDRMIDLEHERHPDWKFNLHQGYAYWQHDRMLYERGPLPCHRMRSAVNAALGYSHKNKLPLPTWLDPRRKQ